MEKVIENRVKELLKDNDYKGLLELKKYENAELKMSKKDIISKLNSIISLHEEMKNSYFFYSPSHASGRRAYEDSHSLDTIIFTDVSIIRVVQETSCSCKNVYYSMSIYEDGKLLHKDIRFIKKLLKMAEEIKEE